MEQTHDVKRPTLTHVFLFVLSVLLISSTVIVSVLSYSTISRLQTDNNTLQSKYDELNSQYSNLQSNYTALQQNYSFIQSQTLNTRTYGLEVIHYNITWLANSSNPYGMGMANAVNVVFNTSGYRTMTVFIDVTNISQQGQSYDTEIMLKAVSWWTNQNGPMPISPYELGGGWMQEWDMEKHFAVRVHKNWPEPPTLWPSYQLIPLNFSTIETKAPYATLLLFANSNSPFDGWATVDIYVYMRN